MEMNNKAKLTKEQDEKKPPTGATEEMPAVVGKASRKRASKVTSAKPEKEIKEKRKRKNKDVAKISKKPGKSSKKRAKKVKTEEPQEIASSSKGNVGAENTPAGSFAKEPRTPEGKQPPRLPPKTQSISKLKTWYFKSKPLKEDKSKERKSKKEKKEKLKKKTEKKKKTAE